METEINKAIKKLAEKAEKADVAHDALHYSQAALNLAHALQVTKLNKS